VDIYRGGQLQLRRRRKINAVRRWAFCEKQRSCTPDLQLGPENNEVTHQTPKRFKTTKLVQIA
jgi:hypothetical protein